MTLQHFFRTIVVAMLGVAALALIQQARAEGGEGSGVVPPDAVTQAAVSAERTSPAAVEERPATTASIAPVVRVKSKIADAVRAESLRPLVERYASEHDLPYALADAVIRIESRYNPIVRNGPNMGLTQINFRTAQSLGYQGNAAGLLDAETNLRFGLKYLAQAYRLAGGDTCGTILRYQFGHRTQTMTRASRVYCAKVKTLTAKAD
ncbi:lytic transglycosylase domain-containing protein [Microvirga puerhi]|uniref:Lytic transglycosylase domain-containing protein n=1 Tax=Microvirga puerhi TaxID=2876078 RepID=A0ABS7VI68_9HYPH|nr:lytic transglycosylase domain-containing protein [Microvirga puerhi]MBZ6075214.1 lytic transglycosylase domain-containing protein [Microvirga puerhi]